MIASVERWELEIFEKGEPLLAADTSRCGDETVERWVRAVPLPTVKCRSVI
jgi:hypothetical protein